MISNYIMERKIENRIRFITHLVRNAFEVIGFMKFAKLPIVCLFVDEQTVKLMKYLVIC